MTKNEIKMLGIKIVDYELGNRLNLTSRQIIINYSSSKKWITANWTLSKKIYDHHFDHLILATGKDNSDVMLIFNRTDGLKFNLKNPKVNKSVTINSSNLVVELLRLLNIPVKKDSYIRNFEIVNDNQNFLMIKVA